jgi:hypothetical protein
MTPLLDIFICLACGITAGVLVVVISYVVDFIIKVGKWSLAFWAKSDAVQARRP